MQHTLTAVFERRSDAQHLWDALLASGFAPEKMTRSDEHAPASAMLSSAARKIGRLLWAWRHAPAQRHGNLVDEHRVTLEADSDPDAERAIGIIQGFGPVGFEDREADTGQVDAAPVLDKPVTGPAPVHYPRGTEPGVLQYRAHEDSHYFGTQDADAPPIGNTFQEPAASGPAWDSIELADMAHWDGTSAGLDDDHFRSHWNTTYALRAQNGSYDDYAAAYAFGSEARRSDAGRGREWRVVEAELKSNWEARHFGTLSAWDNFREAVRYGWESVGA